MKRRVIGGEVDDPAKCVRVIAERIERMRAESKDEPPAAVEECNPLGPFPTRAELDDPARYAHIADEAEVWRLMLADRLEAMRLALRCGPVADCALRACRRSRCCRRRRALGIEERHEPPERRTGRPNDKRAGGAGPSHVAL